MSQLVAADVVIAAEQFNPSILSEHWLVQQGIIPEGIDARREEWIFVPQFMHVVTDMFRMMATMDRIQVGLTEPSSEQSAAAVLGSVSDLVYALPETPYRVLGLNFKFVSKSTERQRVATGVREMFYKTDSPLFARFEAEDARFGGYLSKDFHQFRMKLMILPIQPIEEDTTCEGLEYRFNYHLGLTNGVSQITEALAKWSVALEESQQIFGETAGWIEP